MRRTTASCSGDARCDAQRSDDLLVVEVGPRTHDGKRLQRLRGRPEERDQARVAGGELDPTVPDRHRVHDVQRLDHLASRHLDDDRLARRGA